MTDSSLDRAGVKIKFDVYPEQIVDYLALVGDASDNIPGVPKVGPEDRGQVAEPVHDARQPARAPGRDRGQGRREPARAHRATSRCRASWRPSTATSTCRCSRATCSRPRRTSSGCASCTRGSSCARCCGSCRAADRQPAAARAAASGRVAAPDAARAAGRRPADGRRARAQLRHRPHRRTQFERWLQRLEAAELFAFDTETTSLDYMQAEIVGVSFCVEPGHAAYVPLAHTLSRRAGPARPRRRCSRGSQPLLEDPARAKLGHHLKYDAHVLRNHGIELRGMRYDSMLESYVLNSTATRHDIDSTAQLYLGVDTIHYEDVAGKGAKQIAVQRGAGRDRGASTPPRTPTSRCSCTARCGRSSSSCRRCAALYEEIEQPLVPVLLDMEHRGVLIDTAMLRKQSHELAKKLVELEARAHAAAGAPFNLDSPKQLQEVLFGKLRPARAAQDARPASPRPPRTCSRNSPTTTSCRASSSTTAAWRSCKSTYTDKLPEQVDPAHRARAHLLSPGGGRDRSPVVDRSRTCRTSRSARRKAAASARPSSRRRATC